MKGLKNILFIDIETVGATSNYNELSERLKTQWARKASFLKRNEDISDDFLILEQVFMLNLERS